MALIRYRQGFPTRIVGTPRLDRMLRELGAPVQVTRQGRSIRIEWVPIYPCVPIPVFLLAEPFQDSKGRIEIESVTED